MCYILNEKQVNNYFGRFKKELIKKLEYYKTSKVDGKNCHTF